MGISLRQLIKSLTQTKEFIAEENDKLDKKFATEIQAMCSLYNGQLSAVSMLDQQVGLQDGPIGTIISYMGKTAPRHYLACDGTTYNIADYPLLADHFKREFGSVNYFGGDGTTTFVVPDLRGEFLRGSGTNSRANQGSGSDVGVHQNATTHLATTLGFSNEIKVQGIRNQNEIQTNTDSITWGSENDECAVATTTKRTKYNEPKMFTSRPTNTSILYCIKASAAYFCNVEAQANVFDTTKPVIIGTYNESFIYRKIFAYRFTPTALDTTYALSSDIGKILNLYGTIESQLSSDNYVTCPLGYAYPVDDAYDVGVYHSKAKNTIHFIVGTGWQNHLCIVQLIVEYLAK